MKNILSLLLTLFLAVSLIAATDAEARRRLGGGKSTGIQREVPPATPAQNSAAPQKAPLPVAIPPAASPGSKWLGPLAGLAAGGLLASLFMGGGFNGFKLFDLLLIGLLIVGAIALFRALRRKAEPVSSKAANTMQYDYAGAGTISPSAPPARFESARALAPEIGSKLMSGRTMEAAIQAAPRIPADFEIEPFLRQARAAFIRLQAANDARDIDDIRDFTTPEMYAELSLQIQQRGATLQRTDILKLDVQLLEVVNEGSRAIASVRYSGEICEEIGKLSETFDEVWHVVKRLDIPHATWLLAGIQQIA